MSLAPKIILHCPISDDALLAAFVEECLRDRVSLIAVIGEGCRQVEDQIDRLIIGDGTDPNRFASTSSHPYETLDEVLNFAERWEDDGANGVQQVRI